MSPSKARRGPYYAAASRSNSRLAEIRYSRGLTQSDVAVALGITSQMYGRIERLNALPQQYRSAFAVALGIELEALQDELDGFIERADRGAAA